MTIPLGIGQRLTQHTTLQFDQKLQAWFELLPMLLQCFQKWVNLRQNSEFLLLSFNINQIHCFGSLWGWMGRELKGLMMHKGLSLEGNWKPFKLLPTWKISNEQISACWSSLLESSSKFTNDATSKMINEVTLGLLRFVFIGINTFLVSN